MEYADISKFLGNNFLSIYAIGLFILVIAFGIYKHFDDDDVSGDLWIGLCVIYFL